jgi:hypothetical protein
MRSRPTYMSMSAKKDSTMGKDVLAGRLQHFDETVRREIPGLLRHYQSFTEAGRVAYVDQPGEAYRVRPWCDAMEIGLAFDLIPEAMSKAEWISTLRGFQDTATGLTPEYIPEYLRFNPRPAEKPQLEERYSTMIVNYALEGLGSSLAHPVANAEDIGPELLVEILASLDWDQGAWSAGHWIDCYASCLYVNRKYFGGGQQIGRLFAWLDTHADPKTGLWGKWTMKERWLQPVNAFYRLTRGTYGQFGRPLPYPEKTIDTLLLHASDPKFFADAHGNACNVLDVVHPLWLCLQQTAHRREEAEQWILTRLPSALDRWQAGRGFAFDPRALGDQGQPGLQGTEMWLSIVYLMATVTSLAKHLSYRPVGVHRLQPALAGA